MFDINKVSYDFKTGLHICSCQCNSSQEAEELCVRYIALSRMAPSGCMFSRETTTFIEAYSANDVYYIASYINANFDIMKEKLVTIYNGYDVSMIKKQAGEKVNLGFDKECFYFLNTGRIDSSKAQWHLIRAFSKVVQKHSECRLIICGQGPYKGMLENIVLVNGLQEKVIFLGFVKNPYAVSKQCDVFVFPSMHEGMPNALIENMICGLPVIATDFRSGAREILAPDTDYRYQIKDTVEVSEYGILTPVCSGNKKLVSEDLEREEKLLADAMLRLVEDSSMRMHYSEQSKKRARDFEIQKQVEQWLSILDGEN